MRIEQTKFVAGGSPAKVPLALDIGIRHNLESHAGTLTRGTLHIGKAAATLSGSYAMHDRNDSIDLHVSGKEMPVSDLVAVLPAFNVQLPAGSFLQGGTLTADLSAAGDAEQPVVGGVIDLANTKLGGFNLGEKLAVIERLAGIRTTSDTEIEKLHTRLQTGPSGTTVEELDLLIPAIGELTGAGTVSPAHALHFKMRAAVKGPVAALGVVPFIVEGTASNPAFRPDAGAILTEELQRFGGKNVGGVDTGKAIDAIKGILGHKKQ